MYSIAMKGVLDRVSYAYTLGTGIEAWCLPMYVRKATSFSTWYGRSASSLGSRSTNLEDGNASVLLLKNGFFVTHDTSHTQLPSPPASNWTCSTSTGASPLVLPPSIASFTVVRTRCNVLSSANNFGLDEMDASMFQAKSTQQIVKKSKISSRKGLSRSLNLA